MTTDLIYPRDLLTIQADAVAKLCAALDQLDHASPHSVAAAHVQHAIDLIAEDLAQGHA